MTRVVVIGGGATGTAAARDLAARGVDAVLVERGEIAAGTSGRMHGLLHSGARYAVSDPASARDCIAENRVLREIAPDCVEGTGGLFVEHPGDPAGYFAEKLSACRDCGVPAEAMPGEEARAAEPSLAEGIERAIRVPDATVDPFRLCAAAAADAETQGARIETGTEVVGLRTEGRTVTGVEVRRDGGAETLRADHVLNAAGAWAGQVAALAGADIEMRPTRGAMAVADYGGVGTVLNRCRPRDEGDIVVPRGGAAILGTTDVPVEDPDDYPREDREVDRLVEELAAVVPDLREAPIRSAYWGVRPLYAADRADATRDFAVLDHADRDGVAGLTSVVGGKLTTCRLMAEAAVDRVCDRLGVPTDCRTDEESLPGIDDPRVGAYLDAMDPRPPFGR